MTWSIFHDELDYSVSFNHRDGLVMRANTRHMSFPSAGMEEIDIEGVHISYTSQEPLSDYSIIISNESFELNLGEEIRSKYFKNYRNFQPPGVLGHYLINPEDIIEAKPFIDGNILYMPFGKRQKNKSFCIPDTYLLDAVLFFIIFNFITISKL